MSSQNPIGDPFIMLDEVESTNNYAMGLVHEGMAQHGTSVITFNQTKGKGQRAKSWITEPGKNLAMSVVLQPVIIPASQAFLLSMTVAVAAHATISAIAGDEVKIKWPNDIYWRDRKAAGILIENKFAGSNWSHAVAGIGINVNQTDFKELHFQAVSLKQITGKEWDLPEIAKSLTRSLQHYYDLLGSNRDEIIAAYNSQLYKLNEKVRLKKMNRSFEAIIKDVNTQGQLIVQHGTEEIFNVGDVEWMLRP